MECTDGSTQVALVSSKTKVAPIKKLTIPRLELCGAQLLARLLNQVRRVLDIPLNHCHAWTDSTIVLHWLKGSPSRLKTYVGNRVSNILELLGPECWCHVSGVSNPADCASRGLFPSELINHELWWEGPDWLKLPSSCWPSQLRIPDPEPVPEEEEEVCLAAVVQTIEPLVPTDAFSSFTKLKRVTAWIMRFVGNCCARAKKKPTTSMLCLSVLELQRAEVYWLSLVQEQHFPDDLVHLKKGHPLRRSSPLLRLHPLLC